MRRTVIAGSLAALAVAGGTAGAIAATNAKDDEQAVLADAARQLGVKTDDLRSALSQAEDDQLDAAVKAGRITQAQADEIKKRRQDEGTVLGLGGRGPGFDRGGPGDLDAAIAKAIGISADKVETQLHAGRTVSEIAKANGTTLAAVKAALKKTGDFPADLIDNLDDFGRFGPGPHPPGGPGFGHP